MTLPALPALGSTSWYAWAQGIHNLVSADSGINVKAYGATGDGTTNDRAAVVSAIATAGTNGTIEIPSGSYNNTGAAIELPAGARVVGAGTGITTWKGAGFTATDRNEITGISFNGATAGTAAAVASKSDVQHFDTWVHHCAFTGYSTAAINLAASADNAAATRYRITDNTFTSNGTAVLGERPFDCVIDGNSSVNAAATGYHMSFLGGRGNRITNNTLVGGIVGVGFFYHRGVAGIAGIVTGNVVAGNRVITPSEEGISFDCRGNEAAATAVVDYGTVASTSFNGAVPQLTVNLDAAFATSGTDFFGLDLIFMSGALAGQAFHGIAHSNAAIFINGFDPAQSTAAVAGDAVAIGAGLTHNVIADNTVQLAGTFGVALWGLCVGNTITGNTVQGTRSGSNVTGSLTVMSLNGIVASTANKTGRLGKAPSTGNSVVGNTVTDTDLVFGLTDFGGGGTYTTLKNRVVGNVISNGTLTSTGHTLLTT